LKKSGESCVCCLYIKLYLRVKINFYTNTVTILFTQSFRYYLLVKTVSYSCPENFSIWLQHKPIYTLPIKHFSDYKVQRITTLALDIATPPPKV